MLLASVSHCWCLLLTSWLNASEDFSCRPWLLTLVSPYLFWLDVEHAFALMKSCLFLVFWTDWSTSGRTLNKSRCWNLSGPPVIVSSFLYNPISQDTAWPRDGQLSLYDCSSCWLEDPFERFFCCRCLICRRCFCSCDIPVALELDICFCYFLLFAHKSWWRSNVLDGKIFRLCFLSIDIELLFLNLKNQHRCCDIFVGFFSCFLFNFIFKSLFFLFRILMLWLLCRW